MSFALTIERLRAHAISASLFQPTTLQAAVDRMGFVQADPIRSPARAQDLILRHRVRGYRAGHLESGYPDLEIEEDILYAYGFLPHRVWQLLQPRRAHGLSSLEKKVLDAVKTSGETHPKELQAFFGRHRVINPWGGYSAATTRALERLRHCGLLRIARREKGIRVYEAARPHDTFLTSDERLRRLILVVARILEPAPERTLRATINRHRHWGNPRSVMKAMLQSGELETETINGVPYIFTTPLRKRGMDVPSRVRFLAPFDPLVWDRSRFEQLWGWSYRFEAYTPVAKRVRGYYAMPLLWRDRVIGWANAGLQQRRLRVELGFVGKRLTEPAFHAELEREVESLREFLGEDSTVELTAYA